MGMASFSRGDVICDRYISLSSISNFHIIRLSNCLKELSVVLTNLIGDPATQPTGEPTQPTGQPSDQPTGQPSDQPSGQPTIFAKIIQSCNQASTSGVYTIRPSSTGPDYTVYCDAITPGGPWMLLWSYYHIGGQNNPLVQGTIPTSPTNGYSHVLLNSFQDEEGNSVFKARKTRFYCTTSDHTRVMHFYTSDTVVNQMAFEENDAYNAPSHWSTGYTLMSDHTAFLPATTNAVANFFTNQQSQFWNFPFYDSGAHHWGIKGVGYRFECDDYPNSNQYTTLHQVWVNVDATVPPSSAPTAVPSASPTSEPTKAPMAMTRFPETSNAPVASNKATATPTSVPTKAPMAMTRSPETSNVPVASNKAPATRRPHVTVRRYVSRSPAFGPHRRTKRGSSSLKY